MNLKEVQEIINLMNEHNLLEIELERNGLKLKLKKAGGEVVYSPSAPAVPANALVSETGAKPVSSGQTINSPMVGTFYCAPSPDSKSFADVGEQVEAGQVVCIIEAMKLMNEIKSEIKGRVVEVLVENGQPVEFGQPLFRVE